MEDREDSSDRARAAGRRPGLTRRELLKLGAGTLTGALLSRFPFASIAGALPLGDPLLATSDRDRWMEAAIAGVRTGNEVLELIDGPAFFQRSLEAIRTATTNEHFVYFINWWLDDALLLNPADANSVILTLLTNASNAGVEIRAMLWNQGLLYNRPNVQTRNHINLLPTGGAIIDARHVHLATVGIPPFTTTVNVGSHHQKLLIVNGSQGLIAFCGGIDFNADRIAPQGTAPNATGDTAGAPFHDVHCRVRGPAARDLLQVFVERWNWDAAEPPALHPEVRALPAGRRGLLGAALAAPAAIANATHSVQIGRTYGNGTRWAGIGGTMAAPTGYPFAPNGTQQAAQMILRGIRAARRFIYVEDQYFVDTSPGNVNLSVRAALEEALPNVEHITVLIPDSSITTLGDPLGINQANFRRLELINYLRSRPGGDKLRVYVRTIPGDPHTYVHCKTWIFDDRYAIVGSANCNRRSFTHDSELAAGIWDAGKADGSALWLPHRLRMRLWAEHLSIDTLEKLEDGVASRRYWLAPDRPVGAPIREYDYSNNAPVPNQTDRERWDERVDPDGS